MPDGRGAAGGSQIVVLRGVRGHTAATTPADLAAIEEVFVAGSANRGPFHVIEVWVENDTMVEVLPPDFAAEYLAWTRPDTVATRMTSAPSSGARHARARSA